MIITSEIYNKAISDKKEAQKIINTYHEEQNRLFEQRLKDNPIFTDNELVYSAFNLCFCGYGLAYPKDCSVHHYWDCSAILKGIADKDITHTDKLPFAFYSIKGEDERNTTRDIKKDG